MPKAHRLWLALLFATGIAAQTPSNYSYQILFTGRTFGYARVPDEQPLQQPTATLKESVTAEKLQAELAAVQTSPDLTQLRIGMGDNLAPDLAARTFKIEKDQVPVCGGTGKYPSSIHIPKSFFNYGRQGESEGWKLFCDQDFFLPADFYDNVAAFFVKAGYDVLVPGKQDFYFGAEYLRKVGDFLEDNHVRMLGANLIQTTSVAPGVMNADPRIPERFTKACHDNTRPHACYHTEFGPASLDLPETVLPWKREFVLRHARHDDGKAIFDESRTEVCVEPGPVTASDPSMVLVPAENVKLAKCLALAVATTSETDVIFRFKDPGAHLVAGLNHMFCTLPNPASTTSPFPDKTTEICKPFAVQIPFFWSERDRPGFDDKWDSCESSAKVPCPYALKESAQGTAVAVFGVVDTDLLANVGTLNTYWENENKKWDTKAKVAAPDLALLQTLELCNESPKCRTAPKVLLAQMSYARAAQLISTDVFAKVFDVVLTQASPEHDTGELETTFTGAKPRFVLTPPFRTGGRVYAATVSKSSEPSEGTIWRLSNIPVPETVSPAQNATSPLCKNPCNSLGELSNRWLEKPKPGASPSPPATEETFQQAVLLAMRKRTKADAAMLQKVDLFEPGKLSLERISPEQVQDQISKILWKDDLLVVLHVTGATIRKLLKQSASFAQDEQNSLNTEIDKGRGLLTLGIYKNPDDTDSYYINGALMSDNVLYTIATTDFIAGGDTGYANLATPDVPPIPRAADFENARVRPIAGLVCAEISGRPQDCLDTGLGKDYFTRSRQRPFDATPGFSTRQHWGSFFLNFVEPRRPALNSEQQTQQRPFWQVNLENLDFSESGLFINHIAATKSDLGGISSPLVTTTGSSNVGADHKARLIYDYQWGTSYLLSDLSYVRNATTSKGISLADNILGSEFGGTVRIWTRRPPTRLTPNRHDLGQRPSWLSFQYSVRYEREVTNPAETPESLKGGLSTLFPTPKISNLYGKLGMRAEIGSTYLETGVEEINSRGLLQQYQIIQNGKNLYCQPGSNALLCGPVAALNSPSDNKPVASETQLANSFTATFSTANFLVPGAYLNFLWKFPIWSRQDANRKDQSWYFTLTNKGDIYFNNPGDTNVQTRYLDKLTPALSFPIWGNISLTPKVDFILYEDKVNRYHYRAISPSISVSYTFSVREGMVWTRGLAYGAQTTTPSAAGSTH